MKLQKEDKPYFNIGCSLSESIKLFDDVEIRNGSISEGEKFAKEIGIDEIVTETFFTNIRTITNRDTFIDTFMNLPLIF